MSPFHPKQELAFLSHAREICYGGSTRAGKSHLTRLALIIWCSRIPGLQCDIFRLNFDDVVANHMQGPNSFPDMLDQWVQDKIVEMTQTEIRFNNGSLISLEHCGSERVLLKHQGVPKHVRVLEEATQIRERYIRWLRAWCTMPVEMKEKLPSQIGDLYPHLTDEEIKGMFPKILYPTNPIGESAGYFRRNFVKARAPYVVEKAPVNDGGMLRVYIPAKVEDNPSEDPEDTRLRVSGMGDEALADALLNENWDAQVGDFIKQWSDEKHFIPTFTPPEHWFKFLSFDWGGAEPFCVLWFCVSDGEEFEGEVIHGVDPGTGSAIKELRTLWYPAGALIAYREWYGCQEMDHSVGLDLENSAIAKGIIARTKEVTSGVTLTDSLPFQKRGAELMAETFKKNGVVLTRGNTDRVVGWKRVKDLLTGQDGWPLLYIMRCCVHTGEYIPMLQRHKTNPEDAQESGEATHACDTVRLACMTRPPIKTKVKIPLPENIPRHKMNVNTDAILRKLKKQQQKHGRR